MGEVEGGRVVKLQSGTLEIGNAARDDEGEYKCRVANAAGEQFHTIRLNVTSECVLKCALSMQPHTICLYNRLLSSISVMNILN